MNTKGSINRGGDNNYDEDLQDDISEHTFMSDSDDLDHPKNNPRNKNGNSTDKPLRKSSKLNKLKSEIDNNSDDDERNNGQNNYNDLIEKIKKKNALIQTLRDAMESDDRVKFDMRNKI